MNIEKYVFFIIFLNFINFCFNQKAKIFNFSVKKDITNCYYLLFYLIIFVNFFSSIYIAQKYGLIIRIYIRLS